MSSPTPAAEIHQPGETAATTATTELVATPQEIPDFKALREGADLASAAFSTPPPAAVVRAAAKESPKAPVPPPAVAPRPKSASRPHQLTQSAAGVSGIVIDEDFAKAEAFFNADPALLRTAQAGATRVVVEEHEPPSQFALEERVRTLEKRNSCLLLIILGLIVLLVVVLVGSKYS